MSGYSLGELSGRGWALANGDAQPGLRGLRNALTRGESCRAITRTERKDGTTWTVNLALEPLRSADGELQYFLCLHTTAADDDFAIPDDELLLDATGVAKEDSAIRNVGATRSKLASLDKIDPITGLLRFSHFDETLRQELATARIDQRYATLLVFSIVELDLYQQTFGSKAAEYCQRMIGAQILRTLRRASDLCGRYDDSTLVAAVFGQTPDEAKLLGTRIENDVRGLALHNPRGKLTRQITLETAIVGCPPTSTDDPEALITRALASLRAAQSGAFAASAS
jgi:diguanylate cyclase (GGDEF)-like protein